MTNTCNLLATRPSGKPVLSVLAELSRAKEIERPSTSRRSSAATHEVVVFIHTNVTL